VTPLTRLLCAIDELGDLSNHDVRLVLRRTYFDSHGRGAYVAEVSGYEPRISVSSTSPDAAVEALSVEVEARCEGIKRMVGR